MCKLVLCILLHIPRTSLHSVSALFFFFFFNDTATTEIYTLSLHDALPISPHGQPVCLDRGDLARVTREERSEEHTSELQSLRHLVCRLLLEKKKESHMLLRQAE